MRKELSVLGGPQSTNPQAGDITWACQFGALWSGVLALGISAFQRIVSKQSFEPLTFSEKIVRVVAVLMTTAIGILVILRLLGIIW